LLLTKGRLQTSVLISKILTQVLIRATGLKRTEKIRFLRRTQRLFLIVIKVRARA